MPDAVTPGAQCGAVATPDVADGIVVAIVGHGEYSDRIEVPLAWAPASEAARLRAQCEAALAACEWNGFEIHTVPRASFPPPPPPIVDRDPGDE